MPEPTSANNQIAPHQADEQRFRQIAEGLPNIVWTAQPDGRVDYYNQRWHEYTGQSVDTGHGNGWQIVIHEQDIQRSLHAWQHAVRTGTPYECEHRLRRHDGVFRWYLSRGFPLRDSTNHVMKWFGTATDVHDAKTASELLRLAKEQAEAANRAKDEFLAALSHELRTPLTPVLMTAQALEANTDLPPDVRADIQSLRRQVELEARLIDDLLDLTRITHGKLQLRHEPLNVHDLIAHALDTCCSQAKRGDEIRFIDHYDAAQTIVNGDAARLQQVFWNILSNAVKFTPRGTITIHTRNTPDAIVITITDTGLGIEPDVLPRIFNAFEQGGPHTTRRFGGLGLGLAITKSLVYAHGGTIEAASAGVGQGATFTVTLPLAAVQSINREPLKPLVAGESSQYRILLVEDHEPTARVLRRLLLMARHRVAVASTIAEALAIADCENFDLVISDLGLPDGSGHELISQLNKRYGLTGIALSGYGMDEDVARSKAAGFVEHLTKPITFDRLSEAIARVAAHRV